MDFSALILGGNLVKYVIQRKGIWGCIVSLGNSDIIRNEYLIFFPPFVVQTLCPLVQFHKTQETNSGNASACFFVNLAFVFV